MNIYFNYVSYISRYISRFVSESLRILVDKTSSWRYLRNLFLFLQLTKRSAGISVTYRQIIYPPLILDSYN